MSNASAGAAARNEEKLAQLAKALRWMASPSRSILKLLNRDDVLEVMERTLVRVFDSKRKLLRCSASSLLIVARFWHFRMLNNIAILGKLVEHLYDAADEEFALAVSRMPENTKDFVEPLSKLFSLGVASFHKIRAGDLKAD